MAVGAAAAVDGHLGVGVGGDNEAHRSRLLVVHADADLTYFAPPFGGFGMSAGIYKSLLLFNNKNGGAGNGGKAEEVTYEKLTRTVEECKRGDRDPLTLFPRGSNDGKENKKGGGGGASAVRGGDPAAASILGSVLHELTLHLLTVVKAWLLGLKSSPAGGGAAAGSGSAEGQPTVVITGGEATLFADLLKPDHSNIIAPVAAAGGELPASGEDFRVVVKQHL